MNPVLDLVSGVLFQPAPTLREVAARGRLALPLAVALAALAISGVASAGALGELAPPLRAALALFTVLFGALGLFLSAALLHLVAELLGGRGTGRGLLAALAAAQAPAALLAPAGLLALAAGWLGPLLRLGIALWLFALQVLAVREGHGLSTGRALAAALLPLGTILLLAFILVASLTWAALEGLVAPDIF